MQDREITRRLRIESVVACCLGHGISRCSMRQGHLRRGQSGKDGSSIIKARVLRTSNLYIPTPCLLPQNNCVDPRETAKIRFRFAHCMLF